MPALVAVATLLSAVLTAGCNGPPETARDSGVSADTVQLADAAGSSDGDVPLTVDKGGGGHAKVGEALSKGAVRAGRVTAAEQLLSGIKVEGKVGDFKIYNDRVAFIIAGNRTTNGYAPFGGELLDAHRLDTPGARSLLGETIFTVGAAVLDSTSVGVVSDGSDGKPAIIRVIGQPRTFPLIGGFLPASIFEKNPVNLVIDYVLAPDTEVLEVRYRVFNKTRKTVEIPLTALAMFAGDGADFFADRVGFELGDGAPSQDYIGIVGDSVSYTILGLDAPLKPLLYRSGIWIVEMGSIKVEPAGELVRRYAFGVGAGTPESLRAMVRKIKKVADPPKVSGTVRDSANAPVAGARVHAERVDGSKRAYYSMAIADTKGGYALRLPSGKYELRVVARGRTISDAVAVDVGSADTTKDLSIGGQAKVTFTVVDGQGVEIPAKLMAKPTKSPARPPRSYGETRYNNGLAKLVFHAGGPGTMTLPPGEYTITAARGFEYEIDAKKVTLTDGATTKLDFKLTRSVDTTGYMCGDFHLHAQWSPDSNDLNTHKVTALAAAGVEIPSNTDHEYISDYNPAIARLGLQKWVRGIVGEELTTFAYGHFNIFPVSADPQKVNNGAVPWIGRTPPELFGDVRKAFPDAVLQINHPRSEAIAGYFTYVRLDPTDGSFGRPDVWSADFDAIEVFNGSGWNRNKSGTVRDWIALLDRGKRVTAIGNSDSHRALSSPVGYPRNYVKTSTDEPAQVNPTEVGANVKAGRVIVSGGPFVTASIGSATHGDTVKAAGGKVDLKIKVQAPTWMNVDTLEVISGGELGGKVLQTVKLDTTTQDPKNPVVRYDNTISLTLKDDAWLIVVVRGGSLDPVAPGKAVFTVVNPIYVDVDGNGRFDPPLTFATK